MTVLVTGRYPSLAISPVKMGRLVQAVVTPKALGKRMHLDPDSPSEYRLVFIPVSKIEPYLRQDEAFYISPNGKNRQPNKYDYWYRVILNTKVSFNAPELDLKVKSGLNHQDKLIAGILDGRHRYAVLRDLGATAIPMALSPESIALAKKWKLL